MVSGSQWIPMRKSSHRKLMQGNAVFFRKKKTYKLFHTIFQLVYNILSSACKPEWFLYPTLWNHIISRQKSIHARLILVFHLLSLIMTALSTKSWLSMPCDLFPYPLFSCSSRSYRSRCFYILSLTKGVGNFHSRFKQVIVL